MILPGSSKCSQWLLHVNLLDNNVIYAEPNRVSTKTKITKQGNNYNYYNYYPVWFIIVFLTRFIENKRCHFGPPHNLSVPAIVCQSHFYLLQQGSPLSTGPVSAGTHIRQMNLHLRSTFAWCSYFWNLLTIKDFCFYFWRSLHVHLGLLTLLLKVINNYFIFTLYPECRHCSNLTDRDGLVDASGGELVRTGGMPVRPQHAI